MDQRLPVFDWIRSVAIIIIVFHHLPWYAFNFYNLTYFGIPLNLSILNELNGYFGLSLFIFMSGYLLNIKKVYFSTWGEIQVFAKRKLIRIFPLYYLALIAFALVEHVHSSAKILIHLLGLQLVLETLTASIPIRTLWFVGFITIFYTVFAIVKNTKLSQRSRLVILIASGLVPLALHIFWGITDYRISLYWGVFWFGVLCAEKDLPNLKLWKDLSPVAALVLVAMVVYFFLAFDPSVSLKGLSFENYLLLNTLMFSYVITTYNVCNWLSQRFNFQSKLKSISYVSYGVYLFHRPIWATLSQVLVNQFGVDNRYWLLAILIIGGLPLIFAVAYGLQSVHDQRVRPYLLSASKVA